MKGASLGSESIDRRCVMRGELALTVVLTTLVLLGGIVGCGPPAAEEATSTGTAIELISSDELQDRYGVTVRLLAVTAGGGMVDLRLKILDTEKATRLLGDPPQAPSLVGDDSGVTLQLPDGSQVEGLRLRDGEVLFFLYPNIGGAIRPGTPVSVVFENERLEPVVAQ